MADKKLKDKVTPLSKGQRTHRRRLKQAARKEGNPNLPQPALPPRPVKLPREPEQEKPEKKHKEKDES